MRFLPNTKQTDHFSYTLHEVLKDACVLAGVKTTYIICLALHHRCSFPVLSWECFYNLKHPPQFQTYRSGGIFCYRLEKTNTQCVARSLSSLGGGADGHVGGASADGWGLTGKQAQREHIAFYHISFTFFLFNCCAACFHLGKTFWECIRVEMGSL